MLPVKTTGKNLDRGDGAEMKRVFKSIPGYDCVNAPCKHNPPGDHGIHAEEWRYSLVDDDGAMAISLTCYTNRFPDTVPESPALSHIRPIMGAIIMLHTAFASGDKQLSKCDLLGHCAIYGESYLIADEIVKKHAVAEHDQSDAFWDAMKEVYDRWGAEAKAEAVAAQGVAS